MLNVLLTNDDGIEAEGLQALRRALLDAAGRRAGGDRAGRQPLGDGALDHDAPAAVGRGGRLRRRHASATRPTARPSTACASRSLGLIEGFQPELVVSGINHGANLGDDITYSGTVAAAFEALLLGLPGIAVSQQSRRARARLPLRRRVRLRAWRRRSWRGWWRELEDVPLPAGTLLNVNVPGGEPSGRRGDEPRQAHLRRRAQAAGRGAPEPPAVLHLRRRRCRPTTSRAPTSPRSRPGESPSRRSTST